METNLKINIIKNSKPIHGVVVSNKMQKTVIVKSNFLRKHRVTGKRRKIRKKFYVHSESKISIGKKVTIQLVRPLSKMKRYILLESN